MTLEELRNSYFDETEEGPNIFDDWESLSPKDRIAFSIGNAFEEFFMPKRQRTSVNLNKSELPLDIYPDEEEERTTE
jgi:hypothetical protein